MEVFSTDMQDHEKAAVDTLAILKDQAFLQKVASRACEKSVSSSLSH